MAERFTIVIEGVLEFDAGSRNDARKKAEAWLKGIVEEENAKSKTTEFHVQIDESHWEG